MEVRNPFHPSNFYVGALVQLRKEHSSPSAIHHQAQSSAYFFNNDDDGYDRYGGVEHHSTKAVHSESACGNGDI